jgi:acetylornithine/succinyldiaminopimelate/putrescine aminotransferase
MKSSLLQNFYRFVAQTSDEPLAIEIQSASDVYFYDKNRKSYLDLISGISVCNLGHGNKQIIKAIKNQVDHYMHLMVYGELIQKPQVELAELLCAQLPQSLQSVFFVNSGSEAVEGALKLAKRATGRKEILYFQNAYHGATNGAMSVMGNEEYKKPFYPLLPDTKAIKFGYFPDLDLITNKTAAIIVELIQGEAGIRMADLEYWMKLRKKCDKTGTLLIVDEIQTGLGRTGKLFAFEHYNIVPDILLLAKAFGGGMPLGAFVSSKELMHLFTNNPVLGHITTFGGHPVCCAAALAHLKQIIKDKYWHNATEIGDELYKIFIEYPDVQEVRYKGAFMAVDFYDGSTNIKNLKKFLEVGLFSDWFLWYDGALRIAPPLIFEEKHIQDLKNRLSQL